tara:strand:- start:303 stop:755 length:453 start_codon:yes stop_codon:yes gene_type:complete
LNFDERFSQLELRTLSAETLEKLRSQPELVILESFANAFALIATADGEVDPLETAKYFEVIKGVEALQSVPPENIESAYKAAIDNIKANEETGTEIALEAVSLAKGNDDNVELILSTCQAAIVADARLRDTEDKIMQRICTALGVNPDDF